MAWTTCLTGSSSCLSQSPGPCGPGDGDAGPEADEDQRVVRLGDLVFHAAVDDGWNGLPAAINARPPDPGDQVADPGSECEVGLDNAKPVHGDKKVTRGGANLGRPMTACPAAEGRYRATAFCYDGCRPWINTGRTRTRQGPDR